MILNPKKTKAMVVRRPRAVNPWSCLGFPFALANLDILGVKFGSSSPLKTCTRYCLSCLSKNSYFEVGEVCLSGHLCVASLLLCICSLNL